MQQQKIRQPVKAQPSANLLRPINTSVIKNNALSAATAVLPLRLFLGLSFIAAGVDKLTDPQFFDANSGGYIGQQLSSYAAHSPLQFILTNLAIPNATLFGAVVLVGELAIGLGTLVGLLSRTAAVFGLILSLTLWLTASWEVSPFFLGSDLPYAMGWLVLAIAGAHPLFSLDGQIRQFMARQRKPDIAFVNQGSPADSGSMPKKPIPQTNTVNTSSLTPEMEANMARRRFLIVAGSTMVAGLVTGVAWGKSLHDKSEQSTASTPATNSDSGASSPAPSGTSGASNPTTATTGKSGNGTVLASVSSIAVGDARKFVTPDSNEKAILIHQSDGAVTALSTTCTHDGCEVDYNKNAQALVCPCHGAEFDIKSGAVIRGPARRPLTSYKVSVDGGNIVYVQQQ